jgi:hypothetical protein
MGMQDRDWYRDEKRQERGHKKPQAPSKRRRSRPVFFVHYLAGFWPGLIAGIVIGLAIGVFI